MTSLYSLITKMYPVGLYDLSEDTNVYKELSAYAEGLQYFKNQLDEALNQCFISNSDSYGLTTRENVFGNTRDSYSNEERRKMLIYRHTLGENDFTKNGLGKFFSSFGVYNYQILELSDLNYISVYIDGDYSDKDKAWIVNQIKMILPAHLNYDIEFNGITWSHIENKNLTFNDMDEKDYSWNFIHSLV